jgi:hypothetical protein
VDAANKLNLPGRKLSVGFPDVTRETALKCSNEKSIRILGIKYRSMEDTTRHLMEDFAKRGF